MPKKKTTPAGAKVPQAEHAPSNPLKDARQKAGYRSARAFAEAAELSVSTYTNYEADATKMPIKVAWDIADMFDISIDELVGRTSTSPQRMHLIQSRFENLTEDDRAIVEDMLDFLSYRHNARAKKVADEAALLAQDECMQYMRSFRVETGIDALDRSRPHDEIRGLLATYIKGLIGEGMTQDIELLKGAYDKRRMPQEMTKGEYRIFRRNPEIEDMPKTKFTPYIKQRQLECADITERRAEAILSAYDEIWENQTLI